VRHQDDKLIRDKIPQAALAQVIGRRKMYSGIDNQWYRVSSGCEQIGLDLLLSSIAFL
jgi:hypothetical protein